jgi:hypothetical protein
MEQKNNQNCLIGSILNRFPPQSIHKYTIAYKEEDINIFLHNSTDLLIIKNNSTNNPKTNKK